MFLLKFQLSLVLNYCFDFFDRSNPGSTVDLETAIRDDGVEIFDKFDVCFKALKTICELIVDPYSGIDGCFIKSTSKGQLLVVMKSTHISDSLILGYGRNLTWSACETNMKGSNSLYLLPALTSTTSNLLSRTSLLRRNRTSHIWKERISSTIFRRKVHSKLTSTLSQNSFSSWLPC